MKSVKKAILCGAAALLAGTYGSAVAQPAPAANNSPESVAKLFAEQQNHMDRWRDKIPPTTGQFKAIKEEQASLPDHTIFRPAVLPARPLPVIAFANGGCRNTPIEFVPLLSEIASRGYVIIAAGTVDVPFVVSNYDRVLPNGKRVQRREKEMLTGAVDWAAAQNALRGSPLYRKLDLGKVAYMGQSCGGVQAMEASLDPRTKTTIVLNSGVPDPKDPWIRALAPKVEPTQLHAPIAYFIGGPKDVGYPWAEYNFSVIDQVPIFNANLPVGHVGGHDPEVVPAWGNAIVAWLDWQLKGSTVARAQFVGANCGLCTAKDWTVKSKHLEGVRRGPGR